MFTLCKLSPSFYCYISALEEFDIISLLEPWINFNLVNCWLIFMSKF